MRWARAFGMKAPLALVALLGALAPHAGSPPPHRCTKLRVAWRVQGFGVAAGRAGVGGGAGLGFWLFW